MSIEENLYDWIMEARRRGTTEGMPPKPAAEEYVPAPQPVYDDTPNAAALHPPAPPGKGPGTELKKLLSRIGIRATENCACNSMAQRMDIHGPEWCEKNTSTILGVMRDEAGKRGLPFVEIIGKQLIRLAIRRARRKSKQ